MTEKELDALEAAAKAATPGPWYAYTDGSIVWEKTHEIHTAVCDSGEKNKNNAAFIAAANPSIILDLIAELRQARAERDWLAERMPNTQCPDGKAECDARVPTAGGKVCYSCLLCWLEAVKEATCPQI